MSLPRKSDTQEARRLAEEVVRRPDASLVEALLADAIGHLADAVDELRRDPPPSLDEMTFG